MVKSHIKYLLSLCILLLSISNQLDINAQSKSAFHLLTENFSPISGDNLSNLRINARTNVISAASNSKESTLFNYAEEVEEDKKDGIISQKKNSENTNISSTLFSSWYNKFPLLSKSTVLRFGKQFFHFSYHKLFIIFQVFRI
jgi:hypothetical protein